jgi:hypothetical protein
MVLIVHHAGKDVDRGARGWSGLRAAADAEISITRNEEDRVASVTKLKDGVDGLDFAFKLNVVNIGMDEDQEPITSCVVEHTEMIPKGARKAQPKGNIEKTVLTVAATLAGLGDDEVRVNDLIAASVAEIAFDEASGKRDRRREVVMRAIESLVAGNRMRTTDNIVVLL